MGDLRTFFVEKFKASETKDEIEQTKLDKFHLADLGRNFEDGEGNQDFGCFL